MKAVEKAEATMLRVVVERKGEVVSDNAFRRELISIGRLSDSDVVIDDPQISAKHLVVRMEHTGGYRVFDQSSNGTFWEGERVATLRFDRETVLRVAGYDVTLIPVLRGGTEQAEIVPAPAGADLYAKTVIEELMPQMEDELHPTAAHPVLRGDPATLPEAELRAISQNGEMQAHIFRGRALIGRAPECDIRFSASDISRQHALVMASKGGYVLQRLSKKNPVEINEHEIEQDQSVLLRDGDVIKICDEEVVFLCPATHPLGKGSTMPGEAAPNFDLAVNRRACFNPKVSAVDVVGFLGTKTWQKFESQIRRDLVPARRLLVDLGYLVGIDREGITSLGRIIVEAEKLGVRIQFIRVTPRIADLLSYSELKEMLMKYVSRTEETAVRRLLG